MIWTNGSRRRRTRSPANSRMDPSSFKGGLVGALHPDLRKQFEKKIVDARNVATDGATAALNRLGVADREAPAHLSADQKALRVKLRAKARQIGDPFDREERKGTFRSLTKIIHEVAYEHWHRMLFARFLAENHLLIHP